MRGHYSDAASIAGRLRAKDHDQLLVRLDTSFVSSRFGEHPKRRPITGRRVIVKAFAALFLSCALVVVVVVAKELLADGGGRSAVAAQAGERHTGQVPTAYQLRKGAGIRITKTSASPRITLSEAERVVERATKEPAKGGALYNCTKLSDRPPLRILCWVVGLPIPKTVTIAGVFNTPRPNRRRATFAAGLVDANTGRFVLAVDGSDPRAFSR
jgi:hypothetical protein